MDQRSGEEVNVPVGATAHGGQGPRLMARSLRDLQRPLATDGKTLLGQRFLCRGGGLLVVGPTGIGKSSFSMQAMLMWAIGRPAFGIAPSGPLKSLLIQAENDDSDLAEMRDGVIRGLELSEEDANRAMGTVFVQSDSVYTGEEFFSMIVEPSLRAHRPDLLWIDPALAYIGADAQQQEAVGRFLRNRLNPLLQHYQCGAIIIHHTNKPKQEKQMLGHGDFAYLGSGSAEWANWSRAVLALQATQDHHIYRLHAAKRGNRIGWVEEDGRTKVYMKTITHAPGGNEIYWRDATAAEIEALHTTPKGVDLNKAANELPVMGTMEKSKYAALIQSKFGLAEKKTRTVLKDLETQGKMFIWEIPRKGSRPEVHVARITQPRDYKSGDEDPKSGCWRQGNESTANKS